MSRRSDFAVRRKKAEVVKTMEENNLPPVASQALADQVGISRVTLWRYLQDMEKSYATLAPEAILELKAKTLAAIAEQMDKVLSGETLTERANSWKGLVAEFCKVAFPQLRFNVNENRTVDGDSFMHEVRSHLGGLDAEWIRTNVFPICDAGPRKQMKPDFSGFKVLEANNVKSE
jgi:hypothetical protein